MFSSNQNLLLLYSRRLTTFEYLLIYTLPIRVNHKCEETHSTGDYDVTQCALSFSVLAEFCLTAKIRKSCVYFTTSSCTFLPE
jgi:hypothetical protein